MLSRRALATGAAAAALAACSATPSAPDPQAPPVTSTAVDPTTSTTIDPCPADLPSGEPLPPEFRAELDAALAEIDAAAPGSTVSASVRIDGYGEVVAHNADEALSPASNQKLFTAYGVLSTLDVLGGLRTSLFASAEPDAAGVVAGDVVVVPGGDPTLTSRGEHALDALAAQVSAAGVSLIEGDLLLDDARHEAVLIPDGWPEGFVPRASGPLSVFMVDDNEARSYRAFLDDPNLEHARELRARLEAHGVVVHGETRRGSAPPGASGVGSAVEIGALESEPVGALVADMLLTSDNETADLLLREVGLEAAGDGSLAAGSAHVMDLLDAACLELGGRFVDGSGVSTANAHSARDLRRFVDLLRTDPIGASIIEALPVAAETGTMQGRFNGTAAAGVVKAKTGSLRSMHAITGILTTSGGRTATFSVVVNGPDAADNQADVDALIALVAAHDG